MKLKIGAACAVIIACALCGRAMTSALDRRCRLIGELIAALRRLRISIADRLEPPKTALASCGTPLFSETAEELSEFSAPAEAWQHVRNKAMRRGGAADCLGEQEIKALDALFSQLGGTGRAQQDLAILHCIAALEETEKAEKARLAESSKLYTTLGVLLGLAIAVLML